MKICFIGKCDCCSYPEEKELAIHIKDEDIDFSIDDETILLTKSQAIKLGKILVNLMED